MKAGSRGWCGLTDRKARCYSNAKKVLERGFLRRPTEVSICLIREDNKKLLINFML
jgi:hypothetical protein